MTYRINNIFHKVTILFIIFIVSILFLGRQVKAQSVGIDNNEYYATLLQVESIRWNKQTSTGIAVLKTSSTANIKYVICTNIEDMFEGDFYACIMKSGGTGYIKDDTVISLKYVRPDLF